MYIKRASSMEKYILKFWGLPHRSKSGEIVRYVSKTDLWSLLGKYDRHLSQLWTVVYQNQGDTSTLLWLIRAVWWPPYQHAALQSAANTLGIIMESRPTQFSEETRLIHFVMQVIIGAHLTLRWTGFLGCTCNLMTSCNWWLYMSWVFRFQN